MTTEYEQAIDDNAVKDRLRDKFCRIAVQSPKGIDKSFVEIVTLQQRLGIRSPRESKSIEVSPAGIAAFRVLGDQGRDLQVQLDAFEKAHGEIGLDVAVSLYGHKMELSDCAEFAQGVKEISPGILTVLFAQRTDKTFSYIKTHDSLKNFDGFINGQLGGFSSSRQQMLDILQEHNVDITAVRTEKDNFMLGQTRKREVIQRWQSIQEQSFERQMPEYTSYAANLER